MVELRWSSAGGEPAAAARALNQPFRKHARSGQPLVVLKMAISLDGQTSTPAGDSPWISSEQSQRLVHRWRAEFDAVGVGIGTVLADDPLLTARGPGALRQPQRVVFDSRARLPLDSRLLGSLDHSPLIVISSTRADPTRLGALREAGAEVILADRIEIALAELGRRPITSLMLEGGATLAAASPGPGRSMRRGSSSRRSCLAPAPARARFSRSEDTLITARFREW